MLNLARNTQKGYKTLTPPIRSALEEFGFRITDDSKHYKLVYRGDRITLARSTHGETM